MFGQDSLSSLFLILREYEWVSPIVLSSFAHSISIYMSIFLTSDLAGIIIGLLVVAASVSLPQCRSPFSEVSFQEVQFSCVFDLCLLFCPVITSVLSLSALSALIALYFTLFSQNSFYICSSHIHQTVWVCTYMIVHSRISVCEATSRRTDCST